jgi:diadenylate cyclase
MVDFFTDVGRSLVSDWRPAVEIAALAVLLYLAFRFLRATRGASVLRGSFFAVLCGLAALFLAAHFLELPRLVWLLERLIALGAIGVLVIFQPEIRRGLVRLGESPFVNLFVRHRSEVVHEIVEAVVALSRRKRGALIAVERREDLENYIAGGVRMDARLSAELLTSLFSDGSPMADGAAIVREAKVAAAGCLIPLSDNPDVAKSLGMRHRAAVGLSEETDAVTVVVAAETGKASVAVRGELMQDVSVEDLRSTLARFCSEVEVEATLASRES